MKNGTRGMISTWIYFSFAKPGIRSHYFGMSRFTPKTRFDEACWSWLNVPLTFVQNLARARTILVNLHKLRRNLNFSLGSLWVFGEPSAMLAFHNFTMIRTCTMYCTYPHYNNKSPQSLHGNNQQVILLVSWPIFSKKASLATEK